MEWISVEDRLPEKEGYYQCLCRYFNKPIKCWFRKSRNGKQIRGWKEYSPAYFLYRKRAPYVVYWKSKG